MRLVTFHRKEGFYPIEVADNCDLAEHARLNPGTLKVCDAITGKTLWEPSPDRPLDNTGD